MAHHKRRRPRSKVRCTLCTDARGGNSSPGKVLGHGSQGVARKQRPRRGHDGKYGWRRDQEDA